MKKLICCLLVVLMMLGTASCTVSQPEKQEDGTTASTSGTVTEGTEKENVEQEKKEESKITPAQLEAEIAKQEVKVTSTKYVVQDEKYKSLYPDMLQAIIKNDSQFDLKNAVVAFAAWDENNLPVKIEGQFDFGDASYIKQCNFNDINLVPGASYGSDSGMSLDSDTNNIKKIKAIVVSYESFDGETWENPLYESWTELYEGKRYSE